MTKKVLGILVVALLVVTMVFGLVACNKGDGEDNRYTIVYLGDSIAEALIGPSPLSERDNYGYYALVGRTNGFKYYNHSVSGHKTSTGIVSGDGLREMVMRDTEDAKLMKSHIQEADMIHISVLGNNLLQYNLGLLMLEVADPDFEEKYEAGKNAENAEDKTLINALEEGSVDDPLYREHVYKVDEEGQPEKVKFDFPPTYDDICAIVARLKELNPDATIVFQKVYNPFYEGSKHLNADELARMATITDDGRFGAEGQKITTIEQLRKVADYLLSKLNGMLDRYLAENPNSIKILDAREAFQNVTERDKNNGVVNLSGNSLGRKLIYEDWTHPSNFGHAVIAGMTQDLLDEMGVSSPDAVKNYKSIRVDQINRLYKSIEGFDADGAINAINSADSYLGVSLAYFEAIDGKTPVVPVNPTATNDSKTSFSEAKRFSFVPSKMTLMQFTSYLPLVFPMLFNVNESYVEFGTDGKMHLEVTTNDGIVDTLLSFLGGNGADTENTGSMLSSFDLEGIIDSTVEPMFPGFKAKVRAGDLAGALKLIQDGLGFNITGLDYEDAGVKYILNYIAQNMTLPADLVDRLPENLKLSLTLDTQYYLKDVKGTDGKEYKAIYLSHIGASDATQPYGIFTITNVKNKNGQTVMEMAIKADFMNATVVIQETVQQ